MNINIYQVNTFTAKYFSGNPAAVCILDDWLSPATMQAIGTENNVLETAFVVPDVDGYGIRWFTPRAEVELFGHGTLAAAHVLCRHLGVPGDRLRFSSKRGDLYVRSEDGWYFLNFPADDLAESEMPRHLIDGLGKRPRETYRGWDDYLAVYDDEADIRNLKPDSRELSQVASRGVIVTALGEDVDFVSRFFAPQYSIPEDAVSATSHTTLASYWSKVLEKDRLKARQLSLRGGDILCLNLGERVEVGGQAITYMIGTVDLG